MFLLFTAPVVVLVATVQRALQLYTPSNVVSTRVRGDRPQLGTAMRLSVVAAGLVVGARLLAVWTTAGGPSWLNLVVLIAIWDAVKFALLAVAVMLRSARDALRGVARHRRSALSH